jgi:MFS family permease
MIHRRALGWSARTALGDYPPMLLPVDVFMPALSSPDNSASPAPKGIYFGWYLVAACFVILFFNAGARFAIGVAFKPIISEFGWSRGQVSMAFMVQMIVFAVSLSVTGWFFDRYGPKKVIIICTLLLAGGCAALALIHTYWAFMLFFGFVAAAGMGGTSVPLVAALVSKWFARRRGLAISLALAGSCLGQFFLVPVITYLVEAQGWRSSYLLIGLAILVFNLVLVKWFIKGEPSEVGVAIDGASLPPDEALPNGEQQNKASNPPVESDFTLFQAMKTPAFWFFALVMFVCGSGDFLVTTHLIPLATDHGHSAAAAGNMLALFGLLALGGILLAGPASDVVGNKLPIALTFSLRVALFILILYSQSLVSLYVFALLFGFTFLITAPLTPTLLVKLYGIRNIGIISGVITTIHHMGGGLWAWMGGVTYDYTGSYRLAFILSAFMAGAAVVSALFIKEKRHKAK